MPEIKRIDFRYLFYGTEKGKMRCKFRFAYWICKIVHAFDFLPLCFFEKNIKKTEERSKGRCVFLEGKKEFPIQDGKWTKNDLKLRDYNSEQDRGSDFANAKPTDLRLLWGVE